MFLNKVQTVGSVSEFLSGGYKIKNIERKINKKLVGIGVKVAITLVAGTLLCDFSMPLSLAHAAAQEAVPVFVQEKVQQTILNAFNPLIDLVKALSYPIAGVMITGGALRYMIGQKEQGITTIQNTAIGYLLVQLSPLFLKLLVGIGESVV
jgi:hypothetical protein